MDCVLLTSYKVTGVFGSSLCIDSTDPGLFTMGTSSNSRLFVLIIHHVHNRCISSGYSLLLKVELFGRVVPIPLSLLHATGGRSKHVDSV